MNTCKRCDQPFDSDCERYMQKHPKHAKEDMPYLFAGYCSSVCQALAVRTRLIQYGKYNPLTDRVSY